MDHRARAVSRQSPLAVNMVGPKRLSRRIRNSEETRKCREPSLITAQACVDWVRSLLMVERFRKWIEVVANLVLLVKPAEILRR